MKLKRFILLIAIIAVVILLYKYPFKKDAVTQTNPESQLINESAVEDLEKLEKDSNLTAFGDLVSIDFVLKIKDSGKVIDTNNPELAVKNNISNYVKGPYLFIIGNSDKLAKKSFDKVLVGWKVGEKKTVEIAPSEKELYLKIERNVKKDLYFAIPRYQGLPLKSFKKLFNEEPAIGRVVSNPSFPWSFKIVNMTENNAVGDPVIKEGKKYNLKDIHWPVEAVSVFENVLQFKHSPKKKIYNTEFGLAEVSTTDNKIIMNYNPKQGKIVDYFFGAGNIKIPAKFEISEITKDEFVLHRIDNLNDKWLVLKAKILERTPNVKVVKEKSIFDKAKITETIH